MERITSGSSSRGKSGCNGYRLLCFSLKYNLRNTRDLFLKKRNLSVAFQLGTKFSHISMPTLTSVTPKKLHSTSGRLKVAWPARAAPRRRPGTAPRETADGLRLSDTVFSVLCRGRKNSSSGRRHSSGPRSLCLRQLCPGTLWRCRGSAAPPPGAAFSPARRALSAAARGGERRGRADYSSRGAAGAQGGRPRFLPRPRVLRRPVHGGRWAAAAGAVPRVPAGAAGRAHQLAPGPVLAGRGGRGAAGLVAPLQAAAPLRRLSGEPSAGGAGGGPPGRGPPRVLPLPQGPRRRAEPGSPRQEERGGAGGGRRRREAGGRRFRGGGQRAAAAGGDPGAEAGGEAAGRAAAAGHAGGLRGAGAGAGRADPAAVPPGVPRNPLPHPLGATGLRQGEWRHRTPRRCSRPAAALPAPGRGR